MSFCDILPFGYTNFHFGISPVNYPPVINPLITAENWAIAKDDEIEQIVL
jgi:hypothetical protein